MVERVVALTPVGQNDLVSASLESDATRETHGVRPDPAHSVPQ